jgi:uncharacterized membrane protein YkoI
MQRISTVFGVMFLAATAVLSVAHAQLPDPVAKAVAARYPKMQVVAIDQDDEDGELVYEVKVRGEGRLIEADFDAQGRFLSSEEDLAWASVPQVVQAAFAQAYPQVQPIDIDRHTRNRSGQESVNYVLEFYSGGQEREMSIAADGKILFDRRD